MSEQTEMIKIDWSAVQAGDVLMHENGDRLGVSRIEPDTCGSSWAYTHVGVGMKTDDNSRHGFSPYRRVPDVNAVPTKLGVYLDKDGDVWELEAEDTWALAGSEHIHRSRTIAYLTPFTPLVPMPTEEQVHATVYNALRGSAVEGMYPLRTINAVMALLTGKEADSE